MLLNITSHSPLSATESVSRVLLPLSLTPDLPTAIGLEAVIFDRVDGASVGLLRLGFVLTDLTLFATSDGTTPVRSGEGSLSRRIDVTIHTTVSDISGATAISGPPI